MNATAELAAELPRVAGPHRNRALAKARAARAVELKTQGQTYEQIAHEMGYANRGTVYRIIHRELEARQVESVETLRATEIARLDALQLSLWDKAMAGDPAAANAVLRIIEQRAKLYGLTGISRRGDERSDGDLTGKTVIMQPHELAACGAGAGVRREGRRFAGLAALRRAAAVVNRSATRHGCRWHGPERVACRRC